MKFLPVMTAVAAIAAGALTAATTVEPSSAATDTVYNYAKPKVGNFSIDSMSLAPNQSDALFDNSWPDGLKLESTGPFCFSTGVNLPQGAVITQVQVFFSTVNAAQPYVELRRKSLATGETANVAIKVLPVTNGARQRANMRINSAIATVDNAEYTYGFGVCPETNGNIFYGARVIYTYTNAGD